MYKTESLRPSNCTVKLHNNNILTVVFDIKPMIISLLNDNSLMIFLQKGTTYSMVTLMKITHLTPNMVRCILEMHGCMLEIDTAKQQTY